MKEHKKINIPFPMPQLGVGGIISGHISVDPFGSYTGKPMDEDEIPVQDADDL